MEINYKCTVWVKIDQIDDSNQQVIIDMFHKKASVLDVADALGRTRFEYLTEYEEPLTPEENGGKMTVEVLNKHGETVFENGLL